jgi:hypothetical protein
MVKDKKNLILLAGLFLAIISVQILYVKNKSDYAENFIVDQQDENFLVNDQGFVCDALLELLALTHIDHDGTLPCIVELTQKPEAGWLRQAGTERWDIVDKPLEHAHLFFELFNSLQLQDEIKPKQKSYDYVLWMGAAYPEVEKRLSHLVQLWESGLRYNQFVLLAGARPLTQGEKDALIGKYGQERAGSLATEADAMQLVYDALPMLGDMKNIEMTVINVPMKETEKGLARPTTGDTIDNWMLLSPKAGSCLVLSSQPYVHYQHSVVTTLLPKTFSVETVGFASTNTKIGIYLDTLARFLYQEKKRLQL